ncbi:MAG: Nif3-like dinuclear metal center hexameric protein [Clostridia bacterium]|nr:Nif3-like dinuclear metal center hexameric protein [Clostridia bacterium]
MDKVTVGDVLNAIDAFAPFASQFEDDNSGLIAGRIDAEVSGVLCSVDVTFAVIEEALNSGCNLIVAHHPILFYAVKSVTDCRYVTAVVLKALNNDINIIAAHTNVDFASGGINDRLAELFKGKNLRALDCHSYVRLFDIAPTMLYDLAEYAKKILHDNAILTIGENSVVTKVAVVSGSGGEADIIEYCAQNNIAFMTADLKHHLAAMADDIDAKIIVFGHFTSESIFVTIVEEVISAAFPELMVICSVKNVNPYRNRIEEKE